MWLIRIGNDYNDEVFINLIKRCWLFRLFYILYIVFVFCLNVVDFCMVLICEGILKMVMVFWEIFCRLIENLNGDMLVK